MVRIGGRTLDETLTWASNGKDSMALPRDRFVRELNLRFTGTLTNGHATEARNVSVEEVLKALGQIRVVANGNDTLRSVNAYRKYVQQQYMRGVRPYNDASSPYDSSNPQTWAVAAASGTKTFIVDVPIDFALQPHNPFDLSACLPAQNASSLNLAVDFSAPTTADITISSAEVETHMKEVFMGAREADKLYGSDLGKLVKMYETEIGPKTIDAAYSELGFAVDITTGAVIQNLGIFTEAGSSPYAASNDRVTKFQMKQESPVIIDLDTATWNQAQETDKLEHQVELIESGFVLYDAEIRAGGLDTRGLKTGDIKLKANTASTGRVTILQRHYL